MANEVKNFWIELELEAGQESVKVGPISETGGFIARISMCDKGKSKIVGYLRGHLLTNWNPKINDMEFTDELELQWEAHDRKAKPITLAVTQK